MSGIAGNIELYSAPQSSILSGYAKSFPPVGSSPVVSSSNAWNTVDNIFGLLNKGTQIYSNIAGGLRGNPVPQINYAVSPNLSAVGNYGVQGGGLPQVSGLPQQGLNFLDSYLAQSQTMNNAASNIGTGIGSQISSEISKYKKILVIGFVIIAGILIFKMFSKPTKKY